MWWDLKLTDAQGAELTERLARSDIRRAMAETIVARDRAAERHRYWHSRYDELAGPLTTAFAEREGGRRDRRIAPGRRQTSNVGPGLGIRIRPVHADVRSPASRLGSDSALR